MEQQTFSRGISDGVEYDAFLGRRYRKDTKFVFESILDTDMLCTFAIALVYDDILIQHPSEECHPRIRCHASL